MRRYDEELLRTLHEYIIDYQKLNGSSPTYRKIANRFPTCFSSTSKVKNYLSVLSEHIEGKELSVCTFRAWADRKSRGRKH